MPTSKGFTGQYADAATGLDYYGARYYDPTLGQFTSADTVTDGANRYGYVAGNPTTFTDPTGHRLWAGGDAGGGGGSGPGTSNNGGSGGGGHKHSGGSHNDGGGFWGAVWNVGGQVLDATTGIPSMIKDVQTIFDGSASTGDKLWAGADLLFNVAMDVTMVVGVGEGVRAFYMGGKIAADVAEHVGEEALEHGGEDALEHGLEHGAACGLSFAASTLVAVPGGQRAIASLKVGDKVTAYDPTTGKTSAQTVEATYINHDTDLLDVTLRVSASSSSATATATTTTKQASTATKSVASKTAQATHDETIHTTANHPWLTADHGWALAGVLQVGEPVITATGSMALVEAVRVLPGAASMWDLTVSNVHDFAVGNGAFVVHNCTNPVLDQEASQAHDLIKFGSQPDHPLTVAVADIQHASGDVEHVAALNQHAWTESNIDATVLSWATEGQTGVATTILDDPALLQGVTQQAAGHAHAEEYIAGYMANNPGSRLLGIGTSTIPCPTCAAIIGGLPR